MLKLVLEHREHWIRNASGTWPGSPDQYNNPFMGPSRQIADGWMSQRIAKGFASAMYKTLYKLGIRLPAKKKPDRMVEQVTDANGITTNVDYDGSIMPQGIRRRITYR